MLQASNEIIMILYPYQHAFYTLLNKALIRFFPMSPFSFGLVQFLVALLAYAKLFLLTPPYCNFDVFYFSYSY